MFDFLKKPILQLDGFKITVLTVVLLVLVFLIWKAYTKKK